MSAAASKDELVERLGVLIEEARAAGFLGSLAGELQAFADAAREEAPVAVIGAGTVLHHGMVGEHASMQALYALIDRVAPSDVPILVLGETGTGKELVANAIHMASRRKGQAFLAENCAAVPSNLLESELFGHKRGSFTGAVADRKGLFQSADGGTVFLDEIGDMPLDMQSKLLRVLEQGEVRPVGSNKILKVDVRLVAATHRDLAGMVEAKSFRADLYYRLNVISLQLPPLRERGTDIELLVNFFLGQKGSRILDPEALALLQGYPWPGNIRQLENEITRASALTRTRIQASDLSPGIQTTSKKDTDG